MTVFGLRLMRLAGILVALVAIWTPAAGQNNTKELHYSLKAHVVPSEHLLSAEATIEHAPSTRFYLNKALTVRHIQSGGRELRYHYDPSAPALPYSPGSRLIVLETDASENVTITYDGVLNDVVAGVNLISPQLVELAIYANWYPIFEKTDDFTFEVNVDLPAGFVIASNGKCTSQTTVAGRSVGTWDSYDRVSDIVLLASPRLHTVVDRETQEQIEVISRQLPESLGRDKVLGLSAGMKTLSALYGPPQVKGVLRLVYSPRAGWGYSRIPLIVVSEERALSTLKQEQGEARDFRDNAHELAHFWWRIADASTPDDWINEGFAEYTAFRLATQQYGKDFSEMRLAEYRQNASRNKTSDAIAETETSSPDREINRYDKATLMFLEAEHRFGRANIDRLMRAMYATFGTSHDATTTKFLAQAEIELGKKGAGFFHKRLYQRPPARR